MKKENVEKWPPIFGTAFDEISVASIPTPIELLEDPRRVAELPAQAARTLLYQFAALQPVLLARASEAEAEDKALTISEAKDRLNVTKDWLYRHADKLPFTRRLAGQLRFSSRGISEYLAHPRTAGGGRGRKRTERSLDR